MAKWVHLLPTPYAVASGLSAQRSAGGIYTTSMEELDVGMSLPSSRRSFLLGTSAITAAVALPVLGDLSMSTAAAFEASDSPSTRAVSGAPTFYVATSGSDEADGLTPETAWATIQKANDTLPANGSVLLFRRGDTFYGEFSAPFGCEAGAYGTGEKPILTMFKLLNRPNGWQEHSDGVWKIDLSAPQTHDGYTATDDANIGFLMVDGVVEPALKPSLDDLVNLWDFYCDIPQHMLFVKSSANPTELAADIKAAPNGNAFGPSGTIISCQRGSNDIHDLHITGSGGCGIRGVAPDVHVHNCLIDYIGGSILLDGTNPRYGNGIEHWVNVKRWLIENNEIAQVYDVAWSPQGHAGSSGSWEDMTVRNNYIHDCNQSFEFWSTGSGAAGGFKRILVDGNICERAGYSAFSDVRPNQNVRVHLLTYLWETPADITIQNNVFDDVYGAYSYHAYEPAGYITRNNTIRMRAGQKMQYQRAETVEDVAAWQEATGRETDSTIIVV